MEINQKIRLNNYNTYLDTYFGNECYKTTSHHR